MDFKNLVALNRSYRRFDNSIAISEDKLIYFIELARLVPSGRNNQPLKYIICNRRDKNSLIFGTIAWAGYLQDWDGPQENERPSAYILVCRDNTIATSHFCDDGIAIQTILLGAVESGFGGCIIGAFNLAKIISIFDLPNHIIPLYIIALGKPIEQVEIEDICDNDVKYYRDKNQIHHVPKRKAEELFFAKYCK